MLILIVAATPFEVEPLVNHFGNKLETLITGAGMVPTAFAMGKQLSLHKYDLIINLGIAGSFDREMPPGHVVEITEDTFAETGAEDDEEFIPISSLGFGENTFGPTISLENLCSGLNLTKARAITVNTVHGNEESIKKVQARLNPQIETMEGAAFFYACRQFNIPCLQIRAVSNYVEKRNRDNWNIPLAIENLNNFAIELVSQIINN
ncbi:futalosine hydrolase [Mucilaginibacter pocheonensis]|uniref:Futalosine hydrolase n=1 Tax=Mucilaginibacter pocheonensis TaxID=398050 RepID=A0ABU1T911_9SPHI|nr:futalosine hydrolase [Mucilaginibacter pocheonensis]MDR6941711.1 futalosine hydrolase [Mucilaginibacter pocheonensis]